MIDCSEALSHICFHGSLLGKWTGLKPMRLIADRRSESVQPLTLTIIKLRCRKFAGCNQLQAFHLPKMGWISHPWPTNMSTCPVGPVGPVAMVRIQAPNLEQQHAMTTSTTNQASWMLFYCFGQLKIIELPVAGCHTHRIHGAGIYANIKGVYWWDPCDHI